MTAQCYPKRADYRIINDAAATLIEKAIPAYSKQLHRDMIQECMSVVDTAQSLCLLDTSPSGDFCSPLLKPWTIRNAHGEPAYYTMNFSNPMAYHIPPMFEHLKRRLNVFQGSVAEYIPFYLMNLNRVVLAKFDPPYYDNVGSGVLGNLVLKAGKRMRLSSANVFMPGAAQHRSLRHGADAVRVYFEHAWWHFPMASGIRDTSCLHNLVYHSHNHVKQVVRLRKTLVKVLKIGKPDSRTILDNGKAVPCTRSLVSLLVDNGRTLSSEKRSIFIHGGIASLIKEGHVVNAILVEPDISRPKFCVMIGHVGAPVEFSTESALRATVSIVNWCAMRNAGSESSLTKVGHTDVIVENTAKIVDDNGCPDGVLEMPWKIKQRDIKRIIDGFCPLFVRTGGEVYYTPPPVASFMLAEQPSLINSQSAVGTIACMFDLVEPSPKKWREDTKLTLNSRDKTFTSPSFPNTLLTHLPRLAGESAMSRMFSFQF